MNEFWNLLSALQAPDASGFGGFPPVAIFFFLLLLTFLTEDGACVLAGGLAAVGSISLPAAIAACFAGIFIGDTGLYWIGRGVANTPAMRSTAERLVGAKRIERAGNWLEERGLEAIIVSRFVAGLRLPTYLAAGFLKTDFRKFLIYFAAAAAVWTPALVIAAYYAQESLFGGNLLLGALALFLVMRLAMVIFDRRRRRKWAGRFKRIYRWEFWPLRIFYFPVVVRIFFLMIRHRSATVFTCANPSMLAGGFVGESKEDIYRLLHAATGAQPHLLAHIAVEPGMPAAEVREAASGSGIGLPAVLKPDVGERGKGVRIVRNLSELEEAVAGITAKHILQEYARGVEFSVFYYRHPLERSGHVFSVTRKSFPVLTGDGSSTIEELILSDPRAVCIASTYLDEIRSDPETVPGRGEEVRLVEVGTHARGAIFEDGADLMTAKLEKEIEAVCREIEGFYFGRFDLKAESEELARETGAFSIVELNGVTSESTNIYDRRFSLRDAYRILFKQWSLAFEIGEQNRALGATPTPVTELIRMYFRARRAAG